MSSNKLFDICESIKFTGIYILFDVTVLQHFNYYNKTEQAGRSLNLIYLQARYESKYMFLGEAQHSYMTHTHIALLSYLPFSRSFSRSLPVCVCVCVCVHSLSVYHFAAFVCLMNYGTLCTPIDFHCITVYCKVSSEVFR